MALLGLLAGGAGAAEAKCPGKPYAKERKAVDGVQGYLKLDREGYVESSHVCAAKYGRMVLLEKDGYAVQVLRVAGPKALVLADDFVNDLEHLHLVDLKSGKDQVLATYDDELVGPPRKGSHVWLDDTGRALWLRGYLTYFDPKARSVSAIDGSGAGFSKPNVALSVQRAPQGLIVTWKTPFAAARTVDVAQRVRQYDACFGGITNGVFAQATGELAILHAPGQGWLACKPGHTSAVRLGVQCAKDELQPLGTAGDLVAYQCAPRGSRKSLILGVASLTTGATVLRAPVRRETTQVVLRPDGLIAWLGGPKAGREKDPLRAQTVHLRTPDGAVEVLDEAHQTSGLALDGTTLRWVRRTKAKQVPVKRQAPVPAEAAVPAA